MVNVPITADGFGKVSHVVINSTLPLLSTFASLALRHPFFEMSSLATTIAGLAHSGTGGLSRLSGWHSTKASVINNHDIGVTRKKSVASVWSQRRNLPSSSSVLPKEERKKGKFTP
uniref:Uncharacterized protein n=1 Tax=Lactuca sativa TaxID=4236 RepID=A0A9R1WG82_LACSA|nr:hypothetical protein LSAT_V11C200059280 [Lactuca sativa]